MIASADGFADALIELVEGLLGMDKGVEALVLAYEDTPIKPTMDSIPGFQHRAVTW